MLISAVLRLVRVLALFLGDERGNRQVRQDATLSVDVHQSQAEANKA